MKNIKKGEVDFVRVMHKIGAFIKAKAIRLAPIDQGRLRKSIDYRIEGNKIILYSDDPNFDAMEYGRPPGELSETEKMDVEEWAHRHGLKSGKGVIAKLEDKGIEVGTPESPLHITSLGRDSYRPFMRPAIHQSIPELKQRITDGLRETYG